MRSAMVLLVLAGLAMPAGIAQADVRGAPLASLEEIHRACRRARDGGPPELYVVTLGSGQWAFSTYLFEDEFLPVDTRRNLRLFDGAAEVLPSGLETVGLGVDEERAEALRAAHQSGARLRLGFFLGFDDPARTSCLIRPAAGVTLVRADVAYVEVIDARGRVLER